MPEELPFEQRRCSACGSEFAAYRDEMRLYATLDLPSPKKCPDCREQARLTFRNERKLYSRSCASCKKRIISNFSGDPPYQIFCPACWYGDHWDARAIGRRYDFSKSFFAQYADLLKESTFLATLCANNENSDYVNHETDDKNCYYNFGGHYNEDCYYNTYSLHGRNNVDCYWVLSCELCYECVDCKQCYGSTYLQDCANCSDCHFCRDCLGCDSCFGSYGLRHKRFCFFNQELTPDEYQDRVKSYRGSSSGTCSALVRSTEHFRKFPRRAVHQLRAEDSLGDRLVECLRVRSSFLAEKAQDSQYLYICYEVKNCADLTSTGWSELAYQSASAVQLHSVIAAVSAMNLNHCRYCYMCGNSDHLFGCAGMNRNRFCILNKQYSQDDYNTLVPEIIRHMKETGEWGEFFPSALSPFAYNESVANDYFPLAKPQALHAGLRWKDEDGHSAPREIAVVPAAMLPESIEALPQEQPEFAVSCLESERLFRLQRAEVAFYRKMNIPVPRLHPDLRHRRRLACRNPRRLRETVCGRCGQRTVTSFMAGSPEAPAPELLLCEGCYDRMMS